MARSPFVWGDNGEQLTPERVEALRAAAIAAQRQAQGRPIKNVWEGLASLTDAWGGYKGNLRADREETEGRAGAKSVIDALLGGGSVTASTSGAPSSPGVSPVVSGGVGFAGQTPSAPAGDLATRLRMKMIDGGLPEHVADGFLMNFQSESGMNPGINEQAPTVPGSHGGYGLYQLTGPRRRAYEAFAAQRGVDVADPDAQIEFMLGELQGPESRAAQSILAAPDAGTAAAAIARDFLRPAPEHLQRRVAEYTGGQGLSASSMGGGAPQGTSPVMQALLQASTDPWVAKEYGPVLQALMGQEQSRQQFAMEQADPMRQLEMQKAQLEIEQMRNPDAPKPIEVGGVLLDPVTYQPIFDSRQAQTPEDPIAALRARASEAGLQPGTPDYAAFMASGGKPENGMVIESDGQGGFRMVQGAGAGAAAGKPFTEGQSKDVVYSTRARGALEVLDPIAGALTNRGDRAAEYDPTGFAREAIQSDEFQIAKNAGDEFLQAILRKDTGAAITPAEQALYGVTYLPQPGDSAALIASKKEARARAVAAIEGGMSPAQMVAQERALAASGQATERGGMLGEDQQSPPAPSINGTTIAPAAIMTMTEQELMMVPVEELDEAGLDAMEQRFKQLEDGQ